MAEEHVGFTSLKVGPTLRLDSAQKLFSVNFAQSSPTWFTDNLLLAKGGTVGYANRRYVHTKLDEFIDLMLKENSNG